MFKSIILLTIVINLISLNLFSKELSNKEILAYFKKPPVCTKYGTNNGFSFSNLDGHIGLKGRLVKIVHHKKRSKKRSSKKECILLPRGYVANIIEKNSCKANIVIHPKSMTAKKAKYITSDIHNYPLGNPTLLKLNFNEKIIPFNKFKSDWKELEKIRVQAKKQRSKPSHNINMRSKLNQYEKSIKAIAAKYKKRYKKLVVKTLASLGIKKSKLEIIEFNYAGCD